MHANTTQSTEASRPFFGTVRQISERNPAFTESALRNLIHKAAMRQSSKGMLPGNGLDVAIVRVGRKVLLDEGKFLSWVAAHGSQK